MVTIDSASCSSHFHIPYIPQGIAPCTCPNADGFRLIVLLASESDERLGGFREGLDEAIFNSARWYASHVGSISVER